MKHIFASSNKAACLAALFVLIVTAGCASQGARLSVLGSPESNPLQCKEIPSSQQQELLCVMVTVNRGDMWFFIGNSPYADHSFIDGFSIMQGYPDGPTLSDFSVSPGGTYLAVVSAAEGHPTLSFENMSYLRRNEVSANALPILSVYPGFISIDHWLSDNQAVIVSDQDLIDYKHGGETGKNRAYLLQLPEGEISLHLP